MSTAATFLIEEIATEAGPWWFQLYVYRDREVTRDLLARAVAAGASALVVTVDVPTSGRREAEERVQFAMPPGIATAHLSSEPKRPSAGGLASALAHEINALFDPRLTWHDLDWLASLSPLPVLVKGFFTPPALSERSITAPRRAWSPTMADASWIAPTLHSRLCPRSSRQPPAAPRSCSMAASGGGPTC